MNGLRERMEEICNSSLYIYMAIYIAKYILLGIDYMLGALSKVKRLNGCFLSELVCPRVCTKVKRGLLCSSSWQIGLRTGAQAEGNAIRA